MEQFKKGVPDEIGTHGTSLAADVRVPARKMLEKFGSPVSGDGMLVGCWHFLDVKNKNPVTVYNDWSGNRDVDAFHVGTRRERPHDVDAFVVWLKSELGER